MRERRRDETDPQQQRLLNVLLSEMRDVGLDDVEQFRDDSGDASEKVGSGFALSVSVIRVKGGGGDEDQRQSGGLGVGGERVESRGVGRGGEGGGRSLTLPPPPLEPDALGESGEESRQKRTGCPRTPSLRQTSPSALPCWL